MNVWNYKISPPFAFLHSRHVMPHYKTLPSSWVMMVAHSGQVVVTFGESHSNDRAVPSFFVVDPYDVH